METAKEFQKLCKGLQHVGIPTADLQKTLAFYESLGFEKMGLYKKFMKVDGRDFDAWYMNLYL